MTRSELYRLLAQPQEVQEEHIPALERLVEAYPYAGSFIYLYLYALAKSDDVRYSVELRRLSAFLPSRDSLYVLITGQTRASRPSHEEPRRNDAFSLIDDFLQDARLAGEDLPDDLHFSPSEGGDYFVGQGQSAERGLSLGQLSASTIASQSSLLRAVPPITPKDENAEQELFTETLAKIYIQQGKYERALRILESLNLHYPQKNRYFADQIRFLKRLIENNSENKDYK